MLPNESENMLQYFFEIEKKDKIDDNAGKIIII